MTSFDWRAFCHDPPQAGQKPAGEKTVDVHLVLDERGEAVVEEDLERWATWVETASLGVARTLVLPDVAVVTTFVPLIEDAEADATPQPFVTRVFGGTLDADERRSATRLQAQAVHASVVEWCHEGDMLERALAARSTDV